MKMQNKEEKIILDIYRELYRESTPSADFDLLILNAPLNELGQKVIDFNAYEIHPDKMEDILDKHLSNRGLYKRRREDLRSYIYLGCSPKYKKV